MRILLNFQNKERQIFAIILMGALSCILPIICQSGTFRDNFEDGDMIGWKPNIEMGVSVIDGQLQFKGAGSIIAKIGETSWKEYSLEARVKINKFANGGYFSIRVMQKINEEPAGYYELRLSPTGTLAGLYLGNRLLEAFRTVEPIEENVWYNIRIIPIDGKMRFYLDEVVIAQLTDANLTGYVDFCSTKGTHVLIDDVIITGPNIPDTGKSGPNSFGVKSNYKSRTIWGSRKLIE